MVRLNACRGFTPLWQALEKQNMMGLKQVCLLAALLMLAGCTTNSYYKDNGTRVTVKRFIGIPYLETEERVTRRPPGSDSFPAQ